MTETPVLEVWLQESLIGTLTLLPGEQTVFALSQEYIDNPARPTLSLSLKDSLGGLITDVRPTRGRVPPFFANLLPEGPLRSTLARQAGVNEKREFFLLWVLGQDLPGGLVIRPRQAEAWPPDEDHDSEDHDRSHHEGALRFSLAGVQLKFSAVLEATGGLTIPAHGIGGSWIVKLPSMQFSGVPENEFSMMEMARRMGMDVPEVRLVPLKLIQGLPEALHRTVQGVALAVRRFDRREDGTRIHMEDFAQVFGLYPDDKYKRASYRNMAEVLWAETGETGITEFVRRFVFNALIGNSDMHLKNWSLIYRDGRNAALAPAYDFVSTLAYPVENKLALNFLKSKNFEDLTRERFQLFAAKARLPEKLVLDSVTETVGNFRKVWATRRKKFSIPPNVEVVVERHLQETGLLKKMI